MQATGQQPASDHADEATTTEELTLDGEGGCKLFAWLWERLRAVLGTPVAAALMRRAISAAAQSYPGLRGIIISRERLTYSYSLPEEFCARGLKHPVLAYQALIRELFQLTGELTGGVMVRGLVKSRELSPWLPDMEEVEKWLTPEG